MESSDEYAGPSHFHSYSPTRSQDHPHSHAHTEDMSALSGRKRVGFTSDTSDSPIARPSSSRTPEEDSGSGGHNTPLQRSDVSLDDIHKMRESLRQALGEEYPHEAEELRTPPDVRNVQKPRPAIRKAPRTPPPEFYLNDHPENLADDDKKRSGIAAHKRAARLSKNLGTYSLPTSRRNSHEGLMSPPNELRNAVDGYDSSAGESSDEDDDPQFMKRASMLLRQHTVREIPAMGTEDLYHLDPPLQSGQVTPVNEIEMVAERVPRPSKYRTGVLGTLLKAQNAMSPPRVNTRVASHHRNLSVGTFSGGSTAANSPNSSPPRSGASTPKLVRPWFSRQYSDQSVSSISKLVESSSMLASPAQVDMGHEMEERYRKTRSTLGKRQKSDNSIAAALKFGKARQEKELKIKIHLAGTLARQNYLRKLCKALMMYGAPTHRLEEYLNMSSRVLEIEAQFLYMPGCMIIAFDDSSIHTSEVKLVRTAQGVDLGKLRDVHEIYKDVVHDRIGVEEATRRLEAIIARKHKFNPWLRVPMYGLASATVGPFAFQARPIDLPFCFILGSILGWLQLIVAPGNDLISNVFEIGATVITSFLARGIGSIKGSDGKEIFCFSAIAQSSIALILPGFMVLSASLELQSKHIVAGSVRMVYAIIYSLFLGFGITIGTVLFGMMYKDATSATQCQNPMSSQYYYLFVVAFSTCLMIINQAKYKQMPSMMVIALIGYVVNFHTSKVLVGNAQVSNTLGALAIGIAANLHTRFGRHVENWGLDVWENTLRPRWVKFRKAYLRRHHGKAHLPKIEHSEYSESHSCASSVASEPFVPHQRKIGYGLAAAAMLPAIFVQVPSGLSVQGSLISGVTSADQITRNSTGTTTTTLTDAGIGAINSVALNVGFSVIQIAIGITVGLFLAALIVYPLGKRRSGLFSF